MSGHDISRAENDAKSRRTSQAAEKLVRAVGRDFSPGVNAAESMPALTPEIYFSVVQRITPSRRTMEIFGGADTTGL